MRKTAVIITLLIICGLGFVTLSVFWKDIVGKKTVHFSPQEQARDMKEVKTLLSQSKPEPAIKIISKYKGEIEQQTEQGKEWLDLFISASEQDGDIAQLVILYDFNSEGFKKHEEASLIVGDTLITQRKGDDFDQLRKSWEGRETLKDKWLVLDADKLLLEGKRDKAIELLQSKTFQGKADAGRLIRLALFTINENPKQAWEYLTDAYRKDPNNPQVRSYRGKLLEAIGKNSLALSEYVAAVQTDPENLALRHQLADFYLRNRRYAQALEVWKEALAPPSLDTIWEQALFWNKTTVPLKIDWHEYTPPEGHLYPLIQYYLELGPDEYWNGDLFSKVEDNKHFLQRHQSTFWMRLINAFKQGKNEEAIGLLQFNPFTASSWDPQLERALLQILAYKKNGTFSLEYKESFLEDEPSLPESQPVLKNIEKEDFFSQLNALAEIKNPGMLKQAIPKELQNLLDNEDAFAAAFLSSGWAEAGLQLSKNRIIPDEFPEWYTYAITQAHRANKGNLEALEFATMQKPTDPLTLLIGELLISEGSPDAGLVELNKLKNKRSDIGYRASWLIALLFIEKGEFEQAKEVIEQHPKLSKDFLGQETLARIALLEGDEDLATEIYASIEDQSAEAKSFLARKAFANKNWKRARELTEKLLKEFPNNPMIRENLGKILEMQEGSNKSQ